MSHSSNQRPWPCLACTASTSLYPSFNRQRRRSSKDDDGHHTHTHAIPPRDMTSPIQERSPARLGCSRCYPEMTISQTSHFGLPLPYAIFAQSVVNARECTNGYFSANRLLFIFPRAVGRPGGTLFEFGACFRSMIVGYFRPCGPWSKTPSPGGEGVFFCLFEMWRDVSDRAAERPSSCPF